MTTAEDLKRAEALVKALKQKKKAEKAKSTLTTEQKEKMQAGVVFGWSATKIADEALNKKSSGRDVILVKKTLGSLGYKYVNGKFVGSRKVRLRVLPAKDNRPRKQENLDTREIASLETITIKKFKPTSKGRKGHPHGTYRFVKRTMAQLIKEGHDLSGKSCDLCHSKPCPYRSRFKSQKKTTKEQFTTLKQGKRIQDRPPDVNRFGLKEGHQYTIKESRARADKIKAAHKKGENVGGTPMAHPEKHDNWEQYNWYPCAYCYEKEALEYTMNPEEKQELENQILRNSYGNIGYHFDGFSLRAFVWRWKPDHSRGKLGLFIDKTVYDLAKDFFHSKGIKSARQARKEQGKKPYVKKTPATEIIKEQVTEIIKEKEKEVKPTITIDDSITIKDSKHPEGITLADEKEEEESRRQEVKDSLINAGRKTKKLVLLAKRKFTAEQLIQMADDLRNERQ